MIPYDTDQKKFERGAKRSKTVRRKNFVRDRLIISKRVKGKNMTKIAEEITEETGEKISFSGVRAILRRDDIKGMLDREYCKLASVVPEATDNIIKAARDFNKYDEITNSEGKREFKKIVQKPEDKKISWEANKLIAQAHGIIPTANQSIVHQTFINQQNNTIIPPVIAELAQKHFGGFVNIPSNKLIEEKQDTVDGEIINE